MSHKRINQFNTAQILLFLSIFCSIYWMLGVFTTVYDFTLTKVIFELLWLPMILMLLIIPFVSIVYLIKDKNKTSSYTISLLISLITLAVLFYIN